MTGTVYLVGAGPGDPGLLTVNADRALKEAQVVVYDRLVSAEVVNTIPAGASKIYVGKASGRHSLPQDEINALLVRIAKTGRDVVRLKGGDPFMFGRGGEEAEYLRANGVPFEVIPGITAAVACAAYAGIPLTHRALSHGVYFVTGHRSNNGSVLPMGGPIDPQSTIVIYMGVASVDRIVAQLIAAGRSPDTPAAVIERGTTDYQRRVITELSELPGSVQVHGVQPPAMIIIGEVVTMADLLDWFSPQPHRVLNGGQGDRASA
ncbi:MAG: uroporphyrinogen-III C-methyltransferase [Gammaproteobacteria bacterium]|nr:uroporphyrinogen-III C-methyltransferase [Gammaproteobacteria bacterium]